MRVTIAGSRRLPAGQAPRLLIRFLAALPADACILLRRGAYTKPGRFERDVENLCSVLHLDHEWCRPQPPPFESSMGREAVYARDIDMISRSDLVLLFFAPDEASDGYSGTAHLMDKAFDLDRPVYAYTVSFDGVVERVGEYDPENRFVDIAPSA